MIPQFPKFKKLELKDKKDINIWTKDFLPYSDYNFGSLYSYDTENDFRLSQLNGNLVIRFRDYITNDPFYSFLGKNKIIDTVSQLMKRAKNEKITTQLKLIGEEVISLGKKISDRFEIREDRDNFDYILSVKEHCDLVGEKFHKNRKFIHKFNRAYPGCRMEILNLDNVNVRKQVIDFFEVWRIRKDRDTTDSKHELIALTRIMDHPVFLNLFALGAFLDKEMIAFILVDINNKDCAESHFFKSNPVYPGIGYFTRNQLTLNLLKLGVKYLNYEQDLGDEKLRFTKEHWNPVKYLKKYTISLLSK